MENCRFPSEILINLSFLEYEMRARECNNFPTGGKTKM